MHLSCCKDKDCMLGRLFESLEEGIVATLCKHVNFVNDVHLVFADCRRKSNLVCQFSDLVNTVV